MQATELNNIRKISILKVGGTQIYWYGKSEVRRKRKMGHVNCISDSREGISVKLGQVMAIVYGNDLAKLGSNMFPCLNPNISSEWSQALVCPARTLISISRFIFSMG